MSNPKHTPGPWVFDKVETSCGHCFRIGTQDQLTQPRVAKNAPSYQCIYLYVDYGSHAEEAEANAKLTAAAPQMLEALEYARMTLADIEVSKRKGYFVEAPKIIASAIAKATT